MVMESSAISRLAAVLSAVTLFVVYFVWTLYLHGRVHMVPTWISTVLLLVSLCWCCWACGRRRRNTGNDESGLGPNTTQLRPADCRCRMFTWEELERATGGFSSKAEIGRGAFGTVYKGTLETGTVVAIKRAKNAGYNESLVQLIHEVSVLSQLSHRNLVKLLGCCVDLVQFPALVYEFLPNGTLQDQLARTPTSLCWAARLDIGIQVAEALTYLHGQAMVRTDVTSANILLDDCFHAKLADFGHSKLVDLDATRVSDAVKGTPGYRDPESCRNSQPSDKSDVYSFGVVLLELISGRKAIDLRRCGMQQYLAVSLVPSVRNGKVQEIIDKRFSDAVTEQEMGIIQAVAQVAVACLASERVARPCMSEVLKMLQNITGATPSDNTSDTA